MIHNWMFDKNDSKLVLTIYLILQTRCYLYNLEHLYYLLELIHYLVQNYESVHEPLVIIKCNNVILIILELAPL